MKKKRLLVRGPGTDDMWVLCGGPEKQEAIDGLLEFVRAGLDDLFTSDLIDDFELKIVEMTDDEISSLIEM